MQSESSPITAPEHFRDTESKFGYKEIVLQQVRRITNIFSKELTKGFWKYSEPDKLGNQRIVAYIPDGRYSYIQSIQVLYDLLLPKFDKEMKGDMTNINKKIDEKHKTFLEAIKKDKSIKGKWVVEKVELMREMFQKLCLFLERIGWLETADLEE